MATFQDKETLYSVLVPFFEKLAVTENIGPKLLASKLKIRFIYKEPDSCILIDLSGDDIQLFPGDFDTKADVEMTMKADVAHKFWQGKVNLVVALTRREITAKGPIPKILKLLPIIKPAYEIYEPFLKERKFLGFGV